MAQQLASAYLAHLRVRLDLDEVLREVGVGVGDTVCEIACVASVLRLEVEAQRVVGLGLAVPLLPADRVARRQRLSRGYGHGRRSDVHAAVDEGARSAVMLPPFSIRGRRGAASNMSRIGM